MEFLEDLKRKTEVRFREENRELFGYRRSLEGAGRAAVAAWDVAYYAEKQRAALYDFDEEALRPYFPAGTGGGRVCSSWSTACTAFA